MARGAMATASDAGEWLPRDDVSRLARVSIDTIRRDAKQHGLPTRTDAAGRILVNVEDVVRIGRLERNSRTGGSASNAAATRRLPELSELSSGRPSLDLRGV